MAVYVKCDRHGNKIMTAFVRLEEHGKNVTAVCRGRENTLKE